MRENDTSLKQTFLIKYTAKVVDHPHSRHLVYVYERPVFPLQIKILFFSPEEPGVLCAVAADGMKPQFHDPEQPNKNTADLQFDFRNEAWSSLRRLGTPQCTFTSLQIGESCEGLSAGAQEEHESEAWTSGVSCSRLNILAEEQCIKCNKVHPLPSLPITLIILGSDVLHEHTIMGLTRWFEVTEG